MEFSKRCCGKCKIEKPLEEFHKNSQSKWGVASICKSCKSMKLPTEELSTEVKLCSKCKEEKSVSLFGKDRKGLSSACKSCIKKYHQEYHRKISLLPASQIKEKTCTLCLEIKDISCFKTDKYNKLGFKSRCEECEKVYRKNYYYSRYNKIRFAKTDNEVRERKRKRYKERISEDLIYKLKKTISNTIRCSFNRVLKYGNRKNSNTVDILGCTIEEFKQHIESQFLNWMNWDNYGDVCGNQSEYNCSWDLDHIIPLSAAKTEEEVYLLNHWSNFQPLCSKVNREEKRNIVLYLSNIILNFSTFNNRPF